MAEGQRAAPFTAENAAEIGRRGGKASGERRRMDAELRKLATDILNRKCTDEKVIDYLIKAGVITAPPAGKKKRVKIGEAMIGGMVAKSLYVGKSPKLQELSVKAAGEIISMFDERGRDDAVPGDNQGGVVELPAQEMLQPPEDKDGEEETDGE